ncbi:MAG TPA: response regulator [Candidatus Choladousia intestinavium]|uniref:Stage 0 sporulation protein A homolog n=1 Tax=Candidatus Choladousia intestinavium TaxID=2840727 RepID=A0A9D1ABP6_9FIRM|nr:response regulator [Candidatus Choladousia intestinavium]
MIRAVICDDETASLAIIKYLIESEGLPIQIVGTALNGQSALELIRREEPDLAFMDIQMPKLNGFEVIEGLGRTKVKIIIITVHNTFAYAQKALRLGACDIITKPIGISQLREAIVRAVGWNYTDNETLNQALRYMYLHYAENINLNSLAESTCCTYSHLAHLFRRYFDMSVLSYLHKIRIAKAAQLLRAGVSVQDAAWQTGYTSMNHFYKYFKLYQGMTPASYRHLKLPEA